MGKHYLGQAMIRGHEHLGGAVRSNYLCSNKERRNNYIRFLTALPQFKNSLLKLILVNECSTWI